MTARPPSHAPSEPDLPEGQPAAEPVGAVRVDREPNGRIYFVSDLHLGDGSHADVFQRKDEYFLSFLDEVEKEAQALIIVGDAMDFEQAWYFTRIVRAHNTVIARLTQIAERMRVVYVYGNHDPDIVLFRDILKWELCSNVVVDHSILAVHGYEFDSFVGQRFEESSVWARVLMLYERIFRTWIRLPLREYYTLSNRAIHYLFYWIARATRGIRWLAPHIGLPRLGSRVEDAVEFWTRGVCGDPMGITGPALEYLQQHERYRTVICGHSHLPGVVQLPDGKSYVNLGSWSFGNSQYGIWDGSEFHLMDWICKRRIRDENYRPILDGRTDRRFEDWFHDEYLGYLRFRGGEEALREGVRPRPWVLSGSEAIPSSSSESGSGTSPLPSGLPEPPNDAR